ncbi:MAG TPA: hypothetical protein PLV78_11535 [Deltaproteobacteria bacterium]|nr:hypothetical protein [Deltaproteobacteria bacterium]
MSEFSLMQGNVIIKLIDEIGPPEHCFSKKEYKILYHIPPKIKRFRRWVRETRQKAEQDLGLTILGRRQKGRPEKLIGTWGAGTFYKNSIQYPEFRIQNKKKVFA